MLPIRFPSLVSKVNVALGEGLLYFLCPLQDKKEIRKGHDTNLMIKSRSPCADYMVEKKIETTIKWA